MPGSSDFGKQEIRQYLTENYPPDSRVLDLGVGQGTYSDLLRDYFPVMDAIEAHAAYVIAFHLTDKYRQVFIADVRSFVFFHRYEIFILGDVLEHLPAEDGQNLIRWLCSLGEVVVSVPYLTKQGIVNDNPFEIHRQDDLTHEIMTERYPQLKLLVNGDHIGIYVRGNVEI